MRNSKTSARYQKITTYASVFLFACLILFEGGVGAQNVVAPKISSIGGITSGDIVVNGKWTGQPNYAPKTASNVYKGSQVVETFPHPKDGDNPYVWYIKGTGFGSSRGTVSLTHYPSGPTQLTATIVNWTDTLITIRPKAPYQYLAEQVSLGVRTASGKNTGLTLNVVAAIKGRGFGQCTWEVAYQRLARNLSIPPTAYPSNRTTISGAYVPRQWDVLFWGTAHTAIISSVPKVSTSADRKTTTYSFTITERNAKWDEAYTTKPNSTFVVKNGSVLQGISSKISSSATSYWR